MGTKLDGDVVYELGEIRGNGCKLADDIEMGMRFLEMVN